MELKTIKTKAITIRLQDNTKDKFKKIAKINKTTLTRMLELWIATEYKKMVNREFKSE